MQLICKFFMSTTAELIVTGYRYRKVQQLCSSLISANKWVLVISFSVLLTPVPTTWN